jgi:DNA repair ATPase RecN
MDIFGTIKNGIDVAQDIWRLLEGIKEAPETLKQLRDEVHNMEILLGECQRVFDKTNLNSEFYPLLRAAEQALRKLQEYVARYSKKITASGALPVRVALRIHQNEAKLQAFSRDIQYHKLTLNLICT